MKELPNEPTGRSAQTPDPNAVWYMGQTSLLITPLVCMRIQQYEGDNSMYRGLSGLLGLEGLLLEFHEL